MEHSLAPSITGNIDVMGLSCRNGPNTCTTTLGQQDQFRLQGSKWLLSNFIVISKDRYSRVKEIYTSYEQVFRDKENRYVFSELGKLLTQVFSNVEKKRITTECKGKRQREWVYCGIMLKPVSSTVSTFRENIEIPYYRNVSLASTEDGNRPSIRI